MIFLNFQERLFIVETVLLNKSTKSDITFVKQAALFYTAICYNYFIAFNWKLHSLRQFKQVQ